MKKYGSIAMVHVKSVFNKVIIVLMFMTIAQMIAFLWKSREHKAFADTIEQSGVSLIFMAAVFAIFYILYQSVYDEKSNVGYTMDRLPTKSSAIKMVQFICNGLIYITVTGIQLVNIVLFVWIYGKNVSETIYQGQSLYVAFYQSEFLNSILPLENWNHMFQSISCIFLLSGMAVTTGDYKKSGKRPYYPVLTALAASILWVKEIDNVSAFLLLFVLLAVSQMFKGGRRKKNEEE